MTLRQRSKKEENSNVTVIEVIQRRRNQATNLEVDAHVDLRRRERRANGTLGLKQCDLEEEEQQQQQEVNVSERVNEHLNCVGSV